MLAVAVVVAVDVVVVVDAVYYRDSDEPGAQ